MNRVAKRKMMGLDPKDGQLQIMADKHDQTGVLTGMWNVARWEGWWIIKGTFDTKKDALEAKIAIAS